MNRCTRELSRCRRLASLVLCTSALLGAFALPAFAQTDDVVKGHVRPFPPGIQRGEMTVTQPPEITMNGKPDRLSMGSRIRDTNNHLVLSAQLVNQQTYVVNYLRENGGPVHQVWILNAEEAKIRLPGMKRSFFDILSGEPETGGATPAQ